MSNADRFTITTPFGTVVVSVDRQEGGASSIRSTDETETFLAQGKFAVERLVGLSIELVALGPCRFTVSLRLEDPTLPVEFFPNSGECLECVIAEISGRALGLATRDGDWLRGRAVASGSPRAIAGLDETSGYALVSCSADGLTVNLPPIEAGETLQVPLSVAWTATSSGREDSELAVWFAVDAALPWLYDSIHR